MAKRTKAKPPLTQKDLDSVYHHLKKAGEWKPPVLNRNFKVDKDVPRFDFRKKKMPKAEAIRRKKARIRELKEELESARRAPLETHEHVYVELKRGSKAWKKAPLESSPVFSLITQQGDFGQDSRHFLIEEKEGEEMTEPDQIHDSLVKNKCMVCRVPVPEESLYCDACVLGVCQGAVSLRVFPQLARIREPSALPTEDPVLSTLFVPMDRAVQMWPSEMPSCQIVEGGIVVDAKTVALAAQELMHKVYEQSQVEIAAITRERDGFQQELQKVCDHEWMHIDDSFDHEFGTEQLHSCICEKCGATKPYEPETFGDEAI